MSVLIYAVIFAIVAWIFVRTISKEPLIPWGKKKAKKNKQNRKPPASSNSVKSKQKKNTGYIEDDPDLFEELLEDFEDITEHMIRLTNNEFVLIAEVTPVNYFLLSQHEQEAIDVEVERWLAQIDYPTKLYFQNRYIDLTEPIEEIQKNMTSQEDLPAAAYQYGVSMLEDLANFQTNTPRYDTKRYILFTYQVPNNSIEADTDEEREEKILDKAFQELYRRFNTAKSALHKAKVEIDLLTTEGLINLLYYTFNRKKAVKHQFKDMVDREKLSLYVTSEQSQRRIELVKEMIENGDLQEKDEKAS
ncbi:hypothetical protein [Bacillus sp. SM2101]|uniref:hypothetical protein n=1 Tax=Bacillus sp. SM2101 TaxID=2805366 RepID=UPI001BDE16D1|nr:hypothetical protein [Bacillus sp. SM2101]